MLYPTKIVLKSLITRENYFSLEVLKLIGTLIKFIEPSLIIKKLLWWCKCSVFFLPDIRINMDHVLGIQHFGYAG